MHLKSRLAGLLAALAFLGTAQLAGAAPPEGSGPTAAEYARSAAALRQRADAGDAAAQNSLGVLHHRGLGVPRDDVEAVRLYKLSAAQGYTAAYANLGVLYLTGQGVARDYNEAVRLFRLGADRSDATALFLLGHCYAEGQGVPRNDTEAAHYLTLAANRGNAAAQNDLGRMYEDGRGVPRNPSEALRLYRAAAEQGNPAAQTNLSRLSTAVASRGPAPPAARVPVPTPTPQELSSVQQKPAEGMNESFDVPLHKQGGVLVVPVLINRSVLVNFVLDSGAADVVIPEQVAVDMMRAGTLSRQDLLGEQNYRLADGSTGTTKVFVIHSLMVGDRVLQNVKGSIFPPGSPALLGQTFLSRFKSWSIDNQRQVLVLKEIGR